MDRWVFFAAGVLSFLLRMEWGIVTNQLPVYFYELGASPVEIGLVYAVFSGILVFTLPLWGYCSDYLGRRKPFMVLGMLGLGPIFLMMSTQTHVMPLLLLRGSTAIFVGAIVPTTWALITDLGTQETIGRRMGLLTSAEMAGFGVGPLVGGVIADSLGFKALWIFVATICLTGGLIFLAFGKEPQISIRSSRKPILFKFSELKNPFKKFFALFTIFAVFHLGFTLLGPNRNVYLVEELGMSKTLVGAFDFIGTLSLTLFQPLAGSFSDRHGRKLLMNLASLSLIAGTFNLYFAENFLQAIPAAILTASFYIFRMASSAYISDFTKREERGGYLGLLNAVGSVSFSLGAIFGGLIIMATSIRTMILLSTMLPTISIVITILILKESKRKN